MCREVTGAELAAEVTGVSAVRLRVCSLAKGRSSARTSYLSLPRKRESSITSSRLLSKRKPWAFFLYKLGDLRGLRIFRFVTSSLKIETAALDFDFVSSLFYSERTWASFIRHFTANTGRERLTTSGVRKI